VRDGKARSQEVIQKKRPTCHSLPFSMGPGGMAGRHCLGRVGRDIRRSDALEIGMSFLTCSFLHFSPLMSLIPYLGLGILHLSIRNLFSEQFASCSLSLFKEFHVQFIEKPKLHHWDSTSCQNLNWASIFSSIKWNALLPCLPEHKSRIDKIP
jgi:hypothetical protein